MLTKPAASPLFHTHDTQGLARQNPDKFCSTLDDPSGKKKRGGGIKAWIKHKKAWSKLMKRRRAWAHVCESFNDNGRTRYRPRPSFSKMVRHARTLLLLHPRSLSHALSHSHAVLLLASLHRVATTPT